MSRGCGDGDDRMIGSRLDRDFGNGLRIRGDIAVTPGLIDDCCLRSRMSGIT